MLLSYRPKGRLDLLLQKPQEPNVERHTLTKGKWVRGQTVLFRNFGLGQRWMKGTVQHVLGNRMLKLNTAGGPVTRHFDQSTSKETIVNCFRKAGIKAVCDSLDAADNDEASEGEAPAQSDFADAWQQLSEEEGVPEDVSLTDFITSDEYAVTTEELDDTAIIEWVQEKTIVEDCDDTEEATQTATATEVLNSIDILRSYAGAQEHEQALVAVATYERLITPTLMSNRQAKITDFMTASTRTAS
ncbi:hypothetical protein V5799_028418 [Amblyomma americanum]|uniref:Tick transposon n=1 Tax=Amblyomma americanum TaxID=6943 RepID=A0AAQ4DCX6_AMBAM